MQRLPCPNPVILLTAVIQIKRRWLRPRILARHRIISGSGAVA